MATYQTSRSEGGYTVEVKAEPDASPTFHKFWTAAEAQAWVVEQIGMEEAAERFERQAHGYQRRS